MSNATINAAETPVETLDIDIAVWNGCCYEFVSGGGWPAPRYKGQRIKSAVQDSMVGGDFDGESFNDFRLTASRNGQNVGEFYFDARAFAHKYPMSF